MDVNATKEKKLTNIRTHAHDEALRLTPPRPLTLETAIEFIGTDELVEVTPTAIRLRKRLLAKTDRERERGPGVRPGPVRRASLVPIVARGAQRPSGRAALPPIADRGAAAPGPRHPQQHDRPHPVRPPRLGESLHVRAAWRPRSRTGP